jgi:hypothetical protein
LLEIVMFDKIKLFFVELNGVEQIYL